MNILYIVPSDFESLKKKGVVKMIEERDEGGFFKKVITLHPFTKKDNFIKIKENNYIYEYGWKFKYKFLNKFFITKVIGTFIILFKLFFIFPFVIKKEKIDVIRATDPYLMGLIGVIYSKIFNIPVVVSIHSDYDKRFLLDGKKGSFTIFGSRKLAKLLEKFVYKNVNLILPIREYLKNNIINEFHINENKVKVFPHSIDFDKFDNTKYIDVYKEFNLPEKKIISFIGRFSKENYIYDIVKIAKRIKRDDCIFLLVGAGNEFENIKKEIKDYNNIILTGFQQKEIVVNIRKQSFLSLCLMGGFSLIEACAAARPVIAYDIEWHYELVKNNKTGFLIKEGDICEVVKKINYLLDNPETANKLGKNARELAYKRHNKKSILKLKQNIYKEIFK